MNPMLLLCIGVLLVLSNVVVAQTIIRSLPGFAGDLPFKLETGYVGVGELDEVQLFYYFVESEGNPNIDPLVLWLTGGPGCSGFSVLVYEIGPLSFNYRTYTDNLPTLVLNPYSWTKVANIIFIDAPVGTGFSYARNSEAWHTGDKAWAGQTYEFLRKWLINHPQFVKNPLYIAGDSYGGLIVPIVAQEVSKGNGAGVDPQMNLNGYAMGNPLTIFDTPENFRIPFAHRVALISDELYESTKRWCHGEYVNVDPENALCVNNLKLVTECTQHVRRSNVLEPFCYEVQKSNGSKCHGINPFDYINDFHLSSLCLRTPWCRDHNYIPCKIWANDRNVQEALHVREGTITEWARCNGSLDYTSEISNSLDYHRYLISKGYRALVYSGDHDMVMPYLDTLAWIELLNLTVIDDWKPWFVDGQVAGFTIRYSYKKYDLTFATLKGAGHTGAEYKPREGLAMVYRWFADYSL